MITYGECCAKHCPKGGECKKFKAGKGTDVSGVGSYCAHCLCSQFIHMQTLSEKVIAYDVSADLPEPILKISCANIPRGAEIAASKTKSTKKEISTAEVDLTAYYDAPAPVKEPSSKRKVENTKDKEVSKPKKGKPCEPQTYTVFNDAGEEEIVSVNNSLTSVSKKLTFNESPASVSSRSHSSSSATSVKMSPFELSTILDLLFEMCGPDVLLVHAGARRKSRFERPRSQAEQLVAAREAGAPDSAVGTDEDDPMLKLHGESFNFRLHKEGNFEVFYVP